MTSDHQKTRDDLILELKAAKQRIAELESPDVRSRLFYENLPLPYQSLDENGHILAVNDRWLSALGHRRDAVIGRWFGDFLTLEDARRFERRFAEFRRTGSVRNVEFRLCARNGVELLASFDGTADYNADGAFLRTHCIFYNITEQRQCLEGLAVSEARLREAEAIAGIGHWEHDIPSGEVIWSVQTYRIFGLEPGEVDLTAETVLSFVHPGEREAILAAYQQSVAERTPFEREFRIVRPDGRVRVVQEHCRTFYDDSGAPLRSLGTVQDITERKAAEAALAESERKYRLLAEHIHDMVWTTDERIRATYFSPSAHRLLGYHPEELLNMEWSELTTPASYAVIRQAIENRMANEANGKHEDDVKAWESEWVRKDGSIIQMETTTTSMRDADGRFAGIIGVSRDITERKRTESALRTSEAEKRLILNTISDEISFFKDASLTAEWSNHVGPMSSDGSRRGAKKCYEIWDKGTEPCSDCVVLKTFDTLKPQSVEKTRDDGGLWLIRTRPAFDAKGGLLGVVAVGQDITERKRMENALRESMQRLEMVIEGGELGTYDWDIRTGYDVINRRTAEMLGYGIEEMGYNIRHRRSLMHPDDYPVVMNILNDYLKGEMPTYEVEYRMRHKSGDYVWILNKGRIIQRDADGEPVRMCGTILDITERKTAEERRLEDERRMLEGQRMERIGMLAAGIAHEFNNILTTVLGNLEIVLEDLPFGSPIRSGLKSAESEGRRMAALVAQILAFSGKGNFTIKPLKLNTLLHEMDRVLRLSMPDGIRLFIDLAPELPPVMGDMVQLRQMVMNLVLNAAESYTHPCPGSTEVGDDGPAREKTVVVKTGERECDAAFLADGALEILSRYKNRLTSGRYAFIEVADRGCGMTPRTRKHLFDPFFTTKFMGRGLGMAAVLGIVEGHGGTITIETSPGEGTTCRVFFPVIPEPSPAPSERRPRGVTPPAGDHTVLVVDDEQQVRKLFQQLLIRSGYSVMLAENGEAGVELYKEKFSEIDCVIVDFQMPGISGVDLLKALSEINPDVRAILASGFSEQDNRQRFGDAGFVDFIQKPFHKRELIGKLKRALGSEE